MTYFTYGPDDYVLAADKAQEMADKTEMTWWVIEKFDDEKPNEVTFYKAMSEQDARRYIAESTTARLAETFDPQPPKADPWDDR
jgi:hypothetical protein